MNSYNLCWISQARSLEHSLDFRKPPSTTQKPLSMSLAISCLTHMTKAQVNLLKGLLKGGKCTFFIRLENSHWAPSLTWASECNCRYPHGRPRHAKREGNLKHKTAKSEVSIVYRRGSTLLNPQYPYRYNWRPPWGQVITVPKPKDSNEWRWFQRQTIPTMILQRKNIGWCFKLSKPRYRSCSRRESLISYVRRRRRRRDKKMNANDMRRKWLS